MSEKSRILLVHRLFISGGMDMDLLLVHLRSEN